MPQANDIHLGQGHKLQVKLTANGEYVTISNQTTGSITQSKDKVEVVNKDIRSKRFRPTTVERTGSIGGQVDYSDSTNFRQLNALFAQQAEDGVSIPMRFMSDIVGADNYDFVGIIDSLDWTADVDDIVTFSMDFTVDGDFNVTAVS